MALTTTTGFLPWATRPATIAAVRLMAAGSSTDVPPNFITTRLMRSFPSLFLGACDRFSHRFQLAQAGQKLRIEDGCACRAANGIVRQHGELPVEQVAGTQATHG